MISTEKLSPLRLNDFIFNPISIALSNSIFSVISNLVFLELANFFKASGLKPGDVAVAMNGLNLSLPSEAAQALKALKEQQELSLLIDRNGEITEILFGINNEL